MVTLGIRLTNIKLLVNNTQTIKDIIEEKHEFNKVFDKSKKPLIIIGESALELNSRGYIFEELKNFLYQKKLISEKMECVKYFNSKCFNCWSFRFKILNKDKNNFEFFDNIKNNKFKVLYLLNSDNLNLKKIMNL